MTLSLAQYYRNGQGWELATLDDSEINLVSQVLRQQNNQTMQECIADATALLKSAQGTTRVGITATAEIARQLFERRAMHISVILDAVLRRKVHSLRNKRGEEGVRE